MLGILLRADLTREPATSKKRNPLTSFCDVFHIGFYTHVKALKNLQLLLL